MRISDADTATNLCWGLAFLGTGGGGRVEAGLGMLLSAINAKKYPTIASPDGLPDDTLTCWAIIVGGRDPDTPPPSEELEAYELRKEAFPTIVPRLVQAVKELSSYSGRTIGALVSMELSSAATIATMLTAYELGIPTLDGDYVGRAIPELSLTKLQLLNLPPTPVVMLDRWGNTMIVKHAVGAAMTDRLGRMVSRAAYGHGIATVGNLLRLSDARRALVKESIIKAIMFGAALRRGDLDELRRLTNGRVIFEGRARAVNWRSDEPYTHRELDYVIAGSGRDEGSELRIWIKNEHHAVWKDGVVIGTSPDLIVVLDPQTLEPLTTLGDVVPDRSLIVFAMPALDPAWRSAAGKALLGPRHFGLGFDAVEI
jgi:uncharacterized protein